MMHNSFLWDLVWYSMHRTGGAHLISNYSIFSFTLNVHSEALSLIYAQYSNSVLSYTTITFLQHSEPQYLKAS